MKIRAVENFSGLISMRKGEERELVSGIYETEYKTTVDALNDAVDVATEVISTFLEFERAATLERTSIT